MCDQVRYTMISWDIFVHNRPTLCGAANNCHYTCSIIVFLERGREGGVAEVT